MTDTIYPTEEELEAVRERLAKVEVQAHDVIGALQQEIKALRADAAFLRRTLKAVAAAASTACEAK